MELGVWFWVKMAGIFATVAAVGIGWALIKQDLGKRGERIDEFLRWVALGNRIWSVILIALFAIGLLWWGAR
ncbi:hypothetical protein HZB60_09345 [candidate division KSB1 bacterium]|nr:hypothetical protein [candidate division KSB1 bacterium]